MVRKGKLAIFEGTNMRSCPPKSMYMYVTSTHTCMNFLADFDRLNFLMTMDYIVHGQKGKLGRF